jgi:hypothetical protein
MVSPNTALAGKPLADFESAVVMVHVLYALYDAMQ